MLTFRQHLVAAWGLLGISILLVQAMVRLAPLALEPLADGMNGWQWALYGGWVVFNGYAEGYRGFQTRFSPRVVQRAYHLARNPKPLHVVLAPLFCMSFFHATKRGKIVAWALLGLILTAVFIVRMLPQPWRGIIDAGVVVGLGWGLASIFVFWWQALRTPPAVPPDLPELVAAPQGEPA